APCALANAWPPTAPSNTQVSRNAALRRPRALPAPSSTVTRNEVQLRATDISCLLHALACGCHPAASCTSGAGGRSRTCTAKGKYDQCSTATSDYVTCSVDRGEESVTGVARTALLRSGTSGLRSAHFDDASDDNPLI